MCETGKGQQVVNSTLARPWLWLWRRRRRRRWRWWWWSWWWGM